MKKLKQVLNLYQYSLQFIQKLLIPKMSTDLVVTSSEHKEIIGNDNTKQNTNEQIYMDALNRLNIFEDTMRQMFQEMNTIRNSLNETLAKSYEQKEKEQYITEDIYNQNLLKSQSLKQIVQLSDLELSQNTDSNINNDINDDETETDIDNDSDEIDNDTSIVNNIDTNTDIGLQNVENNVTISEKDEYVSKSTNLQEYINFSSTPLIASFPYPEIRSAQQYILDKLQLCDDKKFIVLEAMPGVGKSAIAKTIATHFNSAYILTATKQLQDQYNKEFKDIASIKGKNNYHCAQLAGANCANAPCITAPKKMTACFQEGKCPYQNAKYRAQTCPLTVTSYAYFLTWLNSSNNQFKPRQILILDECHLLESQIITWMSIKINILDLDSKYHFFEYIKNRNPDAFFGIFLELTAIKYDSGFTSKNKKFIMNIHKILVDILDYMHSDITQDNREYLIKTNWGTEKDQNLAKDQRITRIIQLYDELRKIVDQLNYFLNDDDKSKWLIEPDKNETNKTTDLVLQPLYISGIFKKYIEKWGFKHIIFMSATILNVKLFCEELGITQDEVGIIRVDSAFDPKKSPIYFLPSGKMGYHDLSRSMPNVISKIKSILKKHPNDRGIIHTGNYRIAEEICNQIKDVRLMMKKTYENNEALLKKHSASLNGVLVSPSLSTGTDLKDDLSRFQIIVKMPYMSLADRRVAKKAKLDSQWYTCEMLRTLVQACGRSTRSEDDYSTTYILDSAFGYIIQSNKNLLPQQFMNRIIWNTPKELFNDEDDDDDFVSLL